MNLQQLASNNGIKLATLKQAAEELNIAFENISESESKRLLAKVADSQSKPKLTASEALDLAKKGRLHVETSTNNATSQPQELTTQDLAYAALTQGKAEAQAFLEIRQQAFAQQLEAGLQTPISQMINQSVNQTLTCKQLKSHAAEIVAPQLSSYDAPALEKAEDNLWESILSEPKQSIWAELLED